MRFSKNWMGSKIRGRGGGAKSAGGGQNPREGGKIRGMGAKSARGLCPTGVYFLLNRQLSATQGSGRESR